MFGSGPRIFVSYSRLDSGPVNQLVKRLRSSGFQVWLDVEAIAGGDWLTEIKKGLRHSNFFLACISKNTAVRGDVLQAEWNTGLEVQRERLEGDIYLIPVRLEPCAIPAELADLQCFDLYDPTGWPRLKAALKTKSSRIGRREAIGLVAAVAAVAAYLVFAPSSRDTFLNARERGKSGREGPTASLGLTLWRMQPAQDSDLPSVRDIVHPQTTATAKAAPVELTPTRVPPGGSLTMQDQFQVTIEPSRAGYLYVVNRTLRKNAPRKKGQLLFPSPRIRGGDNRVWPGMLLRLPERESEPPYWEFRTSDPEYDGELLLILLSGRRIPELDSAEAAEGIADSVWAEWTEKFGRGVKEIPLDRSLQRLTPEEADARDGSQLRRDAPLPAILFEATRRSGAPLLVTYKVPMKQ